MSNNISKALKNKTDAQLRLLEQDAAPIVRESVSGDNFIADPNEYSQGLLAGKNITITTSGNNKTINAVMGILAGNNISISEPDDDGKVIIKGTIKGKDINIADFTGKDGYVLSYDETSDKFILTEASSGGSGTDAQSILTIPVNITDFTGKDGYALIYNEQSNQFELQLISGGESISGYQIGWDIIPYDLITLTNIDKPI